MNKLSKKARETWEGHLADLNEAEGELRTALESFNEESENLWGEVEAALNEFNEKRSALAEDLEAKRTEVNNAIEELRSVRDEVVADQENYYDERSERWQEGERGEAYAEWKDTWESAELELVEDLELEEEELEAPEALELPGELPFSDLEDLATEFEF